MTLDVAIPGKPNLKQNTKKKTRWGADKVYTHASYLLMVLPGAIWLFLFSYLPMPGIVMAFKEYRLMRPPQDHWLQNRFLYSLWESPWVGLENFRYLVLPTNIENTMIYLRNTIFYNLLFMIVGLVLAVALAVIIHELTNQFWAKFYHSVLFLPYFISWIVVAYVVYALGSSSGIINNLTAGLGIPPIEVYKEKAYWPVIFLLANIWKYTGNGSIIYLATITAIPRELYEAAAVDGAGKWKQFTSITLPHLTPVIVLLQILAVGRILGSDFDMFYALDVFVYSMLRSAAPLGYPAAAAFLQSVFGFFLILFTNYIVRRTRPELALF